MERDIYDLIARYRSLKESSFYPFDIKDTDSNQVKRRKDETREELQSLKEEINNNPNPQILASRLRGNVLNAIGILLGFVQKSNTGAPLDRNQGLGIENFVFGKVAGVISDSLKNGYGVSYPQFYYQPGGDFDEKGLRDLLLEFQVRLEGQFSTYFELEACVEEYLGKIRDLWEKEDQKVYHV
jgi:hypothetical protein